MQYLLLIYNEESKTAPPTPEVMKAWFAFNDEIVASGNYKAGEALQPTATATTVRVRDGKTLTTDGPFAETKEQLGGFYLVEAQDLDEATAIAAKIPSVVQGSVEIRPLMELPKR